MVPAHLASLGRPAADRPGGGQSENAAAGIGVTADVVAELLALGSIPDHGNHVWDKRESLPILDQERACLRPANYPPGLPAKGWGVFRTSAELPVAIVNLEGRVFMSNLDCHSRR